MLLADSRRLDAASGAPVGADCADAPILPHALYVHGLALAATYMLSAGARMQGQLVGDGVTRWCLPTSCSASSAWVALEVLWWTCALGGAVVIALRSTRHLDEHTRWALVLAPLWAAWAVSLARASFKETLSRWAHIEEVGYVALSAAGAGLAIAFVEAGGTFDTWRRRIYVAAPVALAALVFALLHARRHAPPFAAYIVTTWLGLVALLANAVIDPGWRPLCPWWAPLACACALLALCIACVCALARYSTRSYGGLAEPISRAAQETIKLAYPGVLTGRKDADSFLRDSITRPPAARLSWDRADDPALLLRELVRRAVAHARDLADVAADELAAARAPHDRADRFWVQVARACRAHRRHLGESRPPTDADVFEFAESVRTEAAASLDFAAGVLAEFRAAGEARYAEAGRIYSVMRNPLALRAMLVPRSLGGTRAGPLGAFCAASGRAEPIAEWLRDALGRAHVALRVDEEGTPTDEALRALLEALIAALRDGPSAPALATPLPRWLHQALEADGAGSDPTSEASPRAARLQHGAALELLTRRLAGGTEPVAGAADAALLLPPILGLFDSDRPEIAEQPPATPEFSNTCPSVYTYRPHSAPRKTPDLGGAAPIAAELAEASASADTRPSKAAPPSWPPYADPSELPPAPEDSQLRRPSLPPPLPPLLLRTSVETQTAVKEAAFELARRVGDKRLARLSAVSALQIAKHNWASKKPRAAPLSAVTEMQLAIVDAVAAPVRGAPSTHRERRRQRALAESRAKMRGRILTSAACPPPPRALPSEPSADAISSPHPPRAPASLGALPAGSSKGHVRSASGELRAIERVRASKRTSSRLQSARVDFQKGPSAAAIDSPHGPPRLAHGPSAEVLDYIQRYSATATLMRERESGGACSSETACSAAASAAASSLTFSSGVATPASEASPELNSCSPATALAAVVAAASALTFTSGRTSPAASQHSLDV